MSGCHPGFAKELQPLNGGCSFTGGGQPSAGQAALWPIALAERLAAGCGAGGRQEIGWRWELKSPNWAALPGRALAGWDH
jgi:hypothetical protein